MELIPVVQPCPIRSTETVNCVECKAVLSSTIKLNPNSSQRSSINGAQINPLPCVAIKLMISGVALRAAVIKSPSFSRFSSSTTIISLPFLISSIASGIVFNCISSMSFFSIYSTFRCVGFQVLVFIPLTHLTNPNNNARFII